MQSGRGRLCRMHSQRMKEEFLAASRQWLLASRAALLVPGLGVPAPLDADGWRREAVHRWGARVPEDSKVKDWEGFVRSRLPSPPPPSPFGIMQERYAYDIWRLLVACTSMARICSEKVKDETTAAFSDRFPSPSSFLTYSANPESADNENVEFRQLLRPLGLVENRARTITELTRRFLDAPVFDCGLSQETKIWGCGAFAVDSYLLFCRWQLLESVADASCKTYLDWWRSSAPQVAAQLAAAAPPQATPTKIHKTPRTPSSPKVRKVSQSTVKMESASKAASLAYTALSSRIVTTSGTAAQHDLRRFFGVKHVGA